MEIRATTNGIKAKAVREFDAVLLDFFSAGGEKAGPSADGDKKEASDKVRSSHGLRARHCMSVFAQTHRQSLISVIVTGQEKGAQIDRRRQTVLCVGWYVLYSCSQVKLEAVVSGVMMFSVRQEEQRHPLMASRRAT